MNTITISSFNNDGREYVSNEPITFDVLEETGKINNEIKTFFSIENEDYNIEAFGDTMEEVTNDLMEELAFNWKTYAMSDPDHLSEKAKKVRENYLAKFHFAP